MEKGKLIQNGVHLKAHEYKTVKLFLEQGYNIELIPPSTIKGVRMPDIVMQGVPWEMKSPALFLPVSKAKANDSDFQKE